MSERNMTIPKGEVNVESTEKEEFKEITQEEADYIEKVFFEEDDEIRLRDGKTYRIPPLGLKDARKLIKLLNTIDTGIIISNLLENDNGEDKYNELLKVLEMGFKPYYSHVDSGYLADYVDVVSAKKIIDSMIGLNGLKKLL